MPRKKYTSFDVMRAIQSLTPVWHLRLDVEYNATGAPPFTNCHVSKIIASSVMRSRIVEIKDMIERMTRNEVKEFIKQIGIVNFLNPDHIKIIAVQTTIE
jgi:hypothetical protein